MATCGITSVQNELEPPGGADRDWNGFSHTRGWRHRDSVLLQIHPVILLCNVEALLGRSARRRAAALRCSAARCEIPPANRVVRWSRGINPRHRPRGRWGTSGADEQMGREFIQVGLEV